MRATVATSLAGLLLLVGPAGGEEVLLWRCTDAQDRVTLQDTACPPGQTAEARRMQRPQDPPARPTAPAATPEAAPEPPRAEPPPEPPVWYPPPPMFQCTDYDGEVRYSEDYAPNERCVPLAVLGYDLRGAAPAVVASCRWVRESCLRLDDDDACAQFEAKLRQARSDALHADSRRAPFLRSEVERLERIVRGSCP